MILIAARSNSFRFPGKHLAPLAGSTVLDKLIERVQEFPFAFIIPEGDPLKPPLEARGVQYFEGPERDVLRRHVLALRRFGASYCIRVTGDCPLVNPQDVQWMVRVAAFGGDFGTNFRRIHVDGQEVELISERLLEYLDAKAKSVSDREHVTTYVYRRWDELAKAGFNMHEAPVNYAARTDVKLSIDTPEDLARVEAVIKAAEKQIPIG